MRHASIPGLKVHPNSQVKKKATKVSVLLMTVAIVMSTIAGCGKTASVAPEAEIETTETVEQAEADTTVTEPTVEVTPTPEATPTEAVTESSEEETEEESSEEVTVDMSKVKAFDAAKTMYAMSNINVRKGPSTDYSSVGKLKLGDAVEVIGQDAEGWYQIKYKNEEVAFASNDYLSETEPASAVVQADTLAQAAATAVPTAAPAAAAEAVTPAKTVTAPAGVLFIGDSRCVKMRDAVGGGGCSWICKEAKGYSWFESTAIPQADECIGKGTKVVIALGVNDVGNVNNYAALVNYKAAEWAARGAKTYFVSVNPVWENPWVTEEQVEAFNASIVGQLVGVRWIDTHSYLMSSGYNLVDGMHFDDATSIKIFQAIVGSLR